MLLTDYLLLLDFFGACGADSKLGLIYFESLPRVNHGRENGTDDWRTDHTIFCNMYKREGSYLLASGSDYYKTEVKNKKIKLKLIREKTGFCI